MIYFICNFSGAVEVLNFIAERWFVCARGDWFLVVGSARFVTSDALTMEILVCEKHSARSATVFYYI